MRSEADAAARLQHQRPKGPQTAGIPPLADMAGLGLLRLQCCSATASPQSRNLLMLTRIDDSDR